MGNPRWSSIPIQNNGNVLPSDHHLPPHLTSTSFSFASLLRKPSALLLPFSLLFLFTWLFLRLQRPLVSSSSHFSSSDSRERSQIGMDADANLARFSVNSLISRDRRGWLLDPISISYDAGIRGGAQFCKSIHIGEIRPGGIRGNHRHHGCNETFLIWGADTKLRVENQSMEGKGFAEVSIRADEVAVAASPSGTAHALMNVDHARTTLFLGCQDCIINHNSSSTDYKVWEDLLIS